jgi:hypothetical protein
VIDGGPAPAQPTTVIDLTSGEPVLVRVGSGDVERFGLNAACLRLMAAFFDTWRAIRRHTGQPGAPVAQ